MCDSPQAVLRRAHVQGKAHQRGSHRDRLTDLHVQVTQYPRAAREQLHLRARAPGN